MKSYFLVSFGNSTQYLLTLEGVPCMQLSELRVEIKNYLEDKFPQIKALNYYDQMKIDILDPADVVNYAGYKRFDEHSIDEIKQVLSTEVEDARSLDELNSNAAFS